MSEATDAAPSISHFCLPPSGVGLLASLRSPSISYTDAAATRLAAIERERADIGRQLQRMVHLHSLAREDSAAAAVAGEIDALAQRDSALAREVQALTVPPVSPAPPPADVDALIAACREAASLATNATFAQGVRQFLTHARIIHPRFRNVNRQLQAISKFAIDIALL